MVFSSPKRLLHWLPLLFGIAPCVILKVIWNRDNKEVGTIALWKANALLHEAQGETPAS